MGLISLLEHLVSINFRERALIMMDSQLVAYQVSGKYKVKNMELIPMYTKVQSLLSMVDAEVTWVRRENPIMNEVDIIAKGAARGVYS